MKLNQLEEVSILCGVNKEVILHFIEEDWIHPADQEFFKMDNEDVARIYLIQDLRENFGVNEESIPIILHLLDQLNRIHLEIAKLQQGESL